MQFSLENKTASLSVGEFAGFALGPQDAGGGPQGLWRAQLGQHWHNELQARTLAEAPAARFEIVIDGRLVHRGWTFSLNGRIDQMLRVDSASYCRAGSLTPPAPPIAAGSGDPALQSETHPAPQVLLLREIKSVMRTLPLEESALRAEYPEYFRQLAAYVVLAKTSALNSFASHEGVGTNTGLAGLPRRRPEDKSRAPSGAQQDASNGATLSSSSLRAELVFVEASSGLAQTVALTPFDEALVHHQLDAIVEFLNLRLRATERRRALPYRPAFAELRPGQETIQQDLSAAFNQSEIRNPKSKILLLEAPTGYGKTGCVLEFALGQLRAGRFARLIWLTGKSTGQLQVVHTLEQMTGSGGGRPCLPGGAIRQAGTPAATLIAPSSLPFWQVRNKSEHCVNHTFHCVRDGCDYLAGGPERWPGSGLAKFYLDDRQPHDLETLRTAGREARICPYEITRTALAFNDVWIGDFNYVFAPDNRSLFFEQPGFDPAETLLVIDEAHNLPSRVAGALSHRAVADDFHALLAELDHQQAPATLALAVEEWTRLLASLRPMESLDPSLEDEIRDLTARLANLVGTQPLDYAALGPRHSETLWQFASFAEFLADPKLTKLLWVAREGELEFTCIEAAAAIGETLRGFGGALLMSATLQPYDAFAAACGLDAPVGRVVPDEPRLTGTVRPTETCSTLHAPTPWRIGAYDVAVDLRVETTFKERRNHYGTTAATIEAMHAASAGPSALSTQRSARLPGDGQDKHRVGRFAPATAGGQTPGAQQGATGSQQRCVAVFFPSYAYAESVLRALENSGSVLRAAMQPKLPDLAAQTAWVEESLALADALFLVLGSSFAEGIDLLGGRVTHAMVVGPALPEVNAVQKARLAALAGLGREEAFRRVYQIPGLQKVNQALGRLVRAPGQKAKVLLHCRRFAEPSYSKLLAADYQFYREITADSDLDDWLQPVT